ncbi:hypothetical protein BROUX41_003831 [Berkeleyomyces rouxiae]|uniref:uncharacterized protein n=1 Tax=Berkeleyomyces rouxiae TaxID=2035830 RepID=UPI003B807723
MSAGPAPLPPALSLTHPPILPRITIQFCTQCKWMLRAAYFAQELLSTFATALGEVALQPSTGGVFIVSIECNMPDSATTLSRVLWDRKVDGGFPETKELKRRVRDVIQPGRDLGHNDRVKTAAAEPGTPEGPAGTGGQSALAPTAGDCASGDC